MGSLRFAPGGWLVLLLTMTEILHGMKGSGVPEVSQHNYLNV